MSVWPSRINYCWNQKWSCRCLFCYPVAARSWYLEGVTALSRKRALLWVNLPQEFVSNCSMSVSLSSCICVWFIVVRTSSPGSSRYWKWRYGEVPSKQQVTCDFSLFQTAEANRCSKEPAQRKTTRRNTEDIKSICTVYRANSKLWPLFWGLRNVFLVVESLDISNAVVVIRS